jgi:hypothetical protein
MHNRDVLINLSGIQDCSADEIIILLIIIVLDRKSGTPIGIVRGS